jgi:hypothetical protein
MTSAPPAQHPSAVAATITPPSGSVNSGSKPVGWLDAAWIVGGSLILGALTSFAQGVLPDWLRSFANSPSGWALLTVVMISLRRPRLLPAAGLGAVSFVVLVLGYTLASELRGLTYSPLTWGAIGLVAGPVIGWSTAAVLESRPLLRVLGSSLLAGVALTDAVYGLTVVADTTSPVYWLIVGAAGVIFLGLVAVRGRLRWRHVAVQAGLTVMWVAIGSASYAALGWLLAGG